MSHQAALHCERVPQYGTTAEFETLRNHTAFIGSGRASASRPNIHRIWMGSFTDYSCSRALRHKLRKGARENAGFSPAAIIVHRVILPIPRRARKSTQPLTRVSEEPALTRLEPFRFSQQQGREAYSPPTRRRAPCRAQPGSRLQQLHSAPKRLGTRKAPAARRGG